MKDRRDRGRVQSGRDLLAMLGPGFITGSSDDDPSGIATYAIAGARLGYAPLWTAVVTFPLMAAVEFVCAKVALVSGKGLAGVIRDEYPRWLLYPVLLALLVANTINVAADLQAVGASINLLVPALPTTTLVASIAIAIVAMLIYGSYRVIERIFKWLTLALFAYIGSALLARPDWSEVLKSTLIPTVRLDAPFIAVLVAILGTTISPYLFFWQATDEVEQQKSRGESTVDARRRAVPQALRVGAIDVNVGMLFSNVVMYFIILASAATLHGSGHTQIESAADAAQALRPIAGDLSEILLAVGLIGSGLLAIPILAGSAAYAISEAFGWQRGFGRSLRGAKEFYGVIIAATIAAVAIDFLGVNPFDALFVTAVINGFVAPPLLAIIMLIANNSKVLRDRTNGPITNALGWAATAAMFAAAAGLVLTLGRS